VSSPFGMTPAKIRHSTSCCCSWPVVSSPDTKPSCARSALLDPGSSDAADANLCSASLHLSCDTVLANRSSRHMLRHRRALLPKLPRPGPPPLLLPLPLLLLLPRPGPPSLLLLLPLDQPPPLASATAAAAVGFMARRIHLLLKSTTTASCESPSGSPWLTSRMSPCDWRGKANSETVFVAGTRKLWVNLSCCQQLCTGGHHGMGRHNQKPAPLGMGTHLDQGAPGRSCGRAGVAQAQRSAAPRPAPLHHLVKLPGQRGRLPPHSGATEAMTAAWNVDRQQGRQLL
jgi:hypothetical protein